jgi:hypothetical protein
MIPQIEIKYNTQMHRWEVFSPKSVTRAGEKQPVFVSAKLEACAEYAERIKEAMA